MKIFFRISKLGFGGAERVFISIGKELKEKTDVNVTFVVDQLVSGETEKNVFDLGFQVFSLNSPRTLYSVFALKNLIDKEKPDLIVSAYTDTNFAAILSTKISLYRPKIIVTEHASLKEHWQSYKRLRKLLLKFYVKVGYRFADHILAVSKGIAEQIAAYGHSKNKISCIYNPVRFDSKVFIKDSLKNDLINLLAVGRITPQKDYKTLVTAFFEVCKTHNCKLTIVGGVHDAVENDELLALIKKLNLVDRIEFVGFTEDVKFYYQNADIFILSSAWEGFGNVIVEAMSFGIPVISTDCNHGPSEILDGGKYGRLVPIRSPQLMAKAILETVNELSVIDRNALTERASEFSELKIASQYRDLFEKVTIK